VRLDILRLAHIEAFYQGGAVTHEDDQCRRNASRSALIVGVIGLLGVVLGGAVTGIASVSGIKMQLDENNKETARKERVAAYTNFYHAANKVDNVFADLQECRMGKLGTNDPCAEQVSLARANQRLLTGSFEILRVYATDRALKEAEELKALLETKQIPDGGVGARGEGFPLQEYRAVRDRFTLAMCQDLSPQPRMECVS
jgi:hypothetical protein